MKKSIDTKRYWNKKVNNNEYEYFLTYDLLFNVRFICSCNKKEINRDPCSYNSNANS